MPAIHRRCTFSLFGFILCCQVILPALAEDRSFDGSGNNLQYPDWGAAGATFNRLSPPTYADGISSPAGESLPGARHISNVVGRPATLTGNHRRLSGYVYAFGQFLSHDLQRTASGSELFAIPVPSDDPSWQGGVLPFTRSLAASGTGAGLDQPRQQLNLITSFVDGSQVYGSDAERAGNLRVSTADGPGAHLMTGSDDLLPRNILGLEIDNGGFQSNSNLFLAGDIRVNENAPLTSLHTLFMREHNRLVDELATVHPTWSHNQLYERARKTVGAELQVIMYQEFLPAVLGPHAPSPHGQYDPTTDPTILNEFAAALFRVGHAMLPAHILRVREDGTPAAGNALPCCVDTFATTNSIRNSAELEYHLRGIGLELQKEVDTTFINSLRTIFGPRIDLLAFDIQRGRDHGLPDYNSLRVAYDLPRVSSFEEITANTDVQLKLSDLYGDVNSIDPFIGALAEDHLPGASVGPLTSAVLHEQFRRLRDGDRFWHENDPEFTLEEIEMLQATRLSDIVRRNTEIARIQDNVFFMPPIGDHDLNGIVDAADRATLTANWTGASLSSAPMLLTLGNSDNDGDVDTADSTLLLQNWTSKEATTGGSTGRGLLVYDPATGNLQLDARETETGRIVSFFLTTDQSAIRAGNGFRGAEAEFPFERLPRSTDGSAFQLGQTANDLVGFAGVWDLGEVLPAGLSEGTLADVIVRSGYASGLGFGGTFQLVFLPEALIGDYNGSGTVEEADLDLVLLNWGRSFETLPESWANERPTSGIIDQAELDTVLLNWGNTSPEAPTAAVPEPGSFLLGLLALIAVLMPSRRAETLCT